MQCARFYTNRTWWIVGGFTECRVQGGGGGGAVGGRVVRLLVDRVRNISERVNQTKCE